MAPLIEFPGRHHDGASVRRKGGGVNPGMPSDMPGCLVLGQKVFSKVLPSATWCDFGEFATEEHKDRKEIFKTERLEANHRED